MINMKGKANLTRSIWWSKKLKWPATKLLGIYLCLIGSAVTITSAYALTENEQLLKAAYIFNFAKFTQWPEHIWQDQRAPLNLCITGKDELASNIEKLSGKTIHNHPVSVRQLPDLQDMKNCHLLYIAASEKKHYQEILKSVRNKPVLTVSELPDFGNSGGMIELYRKQAQTHFIINLGIARESGLTISSRLLNLAEIINNEKTP